MSEYEEESHISLSDTELQKLRNFLDDILGNRNNMLTDMADTIEEAEIAALEGMSEKYISERGISCIAVCGSFNAGKSTLLNRLINEKDVSLNTTSI